MPSEAEFSKLVTEAKSGEASALEQLMLMYRSAVTTETRKFAGSLKSDVSVQDLEQETWIRVWTRLPGFAGSHDNDACQRMFLAWLKTTTRRVALSIVEAGAARKRGGDRQPATLIQPIPDNGKSPSSLIRADEVRVLMANAIKEIGSTEAAEIIRLHYLEEVPVVEIAERMGLSVDQVRYRISSALKSLERRMGDD